MSCFFVPNSYVSVLRKKLNIQWGNSENLTRFANARVGFLCSRWRPCRCSINPWRGIDQELFVRVHKWRPLIGEGGRGKGNRKMRVGHLERQRGRDYDEQNVRRIFQRTSDDTFLLGSLIISSTISLRSFRKLSAALFCAWTAVRQKWSPLGNCNGFRCQSFLLSRAFNSKMLITSLVNPITVAYTEEQNNNKIINVDSSILRQQFPHLFAQTQILHSLTYLRFAE